MNWIKLIKHDLICGLFRLRYLIICLLFFIPCHTYCRLLSAIGMNGSWIDYMLYIFWGRDVIQIHEAFELPVMWLLIVGGCSLLNIDYLYRDLTKEGQQVLIHCGSRTSWYLSKCIWNICSCCLYYLFLSVFVFLFALISGTQSVFLPTSGSPISLLGQYTFEEIDLLPWEYLILICISPLLTIIAISQLQITISLFTKPIIGIICSISLILLSLYYSKPYLLGNGAMVSRSSIIDAYGVKWMHAIGFSLIITCISIIIGLLQFKAMDILTPEE